MICILHCFLANLETGFITAEQITLHPVCTGTIGFAIAIIGKVVDARMFKKSANNGAHTNVLRKAGNAGSQCANAAHDQINT